MFLLVVKKLENIIDSAQFHQQIDDLEDCKAFRAILPWQQHPVNEAVVLYQLLNEMGRDRAFEIHECAEKRLLQL